MVIRPCKEGKLTERTEAFQGPRKNKQKPLSKMSTERNFTLEKNSQFMGMGVFIEWIGAHMRTEGKRPIERTEVI